MYEINLNYKEFISKREVILADIKDGELVLKILWKNPDEHIIESVSKTPLFQLLFKNEIMFLLIKFPKLNWVDIPCIFTHRLFTHSCENFPCKIFLANSNTGKLLIKTECYMPKGITKAFVQGVHTQKHFTKKVLKEKINAVHSSFSSDEMLRLSLGNL